MAVTAGMVKELRDKTSAGMMDCKKALQETSGDMEAAVDWLRTKGIARADKKASRVAAEGLVGMAVDGTRGALVEVNSETDFVSRNDAFQDFVAEVSEAAVKATDLDALQNMDMGGKTVADTRTELVGTIGENMNLRRMESLEVGKGVVSGYMHNQVAPGMGKIGVLVALESDGDSAKLEDLAKKIAMHVAATGPLSLDVDSLDPAMVDKERAALKAEALESGKPESIVDKMVEGRMQKFFKESVLTTQVFVMDGENSVEQVVKNAAKDMGTDVKLSGYRRMVLGEGIEKKSEDFAAEVANTLKGDS